MKADELDLLKQFDSPQVVSDACRTVHGQPMHFAVPAAIKDAVKDGLLTILDPDGPIVDGKATYSRFLMLTEKGREACGLQRVEPVKAKPKKTVAKSLFD